MYFGLLLLDIISLLYIHLEAYSMYMQFKWNVTCNQYYLLQQNLLSLEFNNEEKTLQYGLTMC